MAEPLHEHLASLTPAIRAAHPLLLFSDFDGTLVPIKQHAADCYLDPTITTVLQTLDGLPETHVGVISGRSLKDLKPRVGLKELAYAGNHGLEIDGGTEFFHEPTAVGRQPELEEIVTGLEKVLNTVPNVWVEHKGVSASVHYRAVAEDAIPFVLETVQRITEIACQSGLFVLRPGKCVLEIRPTVNWHKGSAIRWLANRQIKIGDEPQIIFLGDDNTDEDAFAVLTEWTTIRVGPGTTKARYFVNDVNEVHGFLHWLLGIRHTSP
jgi:trehalose 6-phosphate phosphatase